jgi:hypothetical protein
MGVFIVAGVGSFNDWQKEKQFLRLQAESDKDNTVSLFFIVATEKSSSFKSFKVTLFLISITIYCRHINMVCIFMRKKFDR